jgi:hypothetical protein
VERNRSLDVILDAMRRIVALLLRRNTLAPLAALTILALAPGLSGRLFGRREGSGRQMPAADAPAPVPAAPARLVHLEPGCRLGGEGPPAGWTHLVLKSIPTLKTGDLDTVSQQAFARARRIRPVIVANVCQETGDSSFRLQQIGVGLCAPGTEPETDTVVSASSVEGTKGSWTAKERLILTAMALETSRARLVAATQTFALLRTPVTFLLSSVHTKVDVCYALLVAPQSGELRTLVWVDYRSSDRPEAIPTVARWFTTPVFDSPLDVSASKILGGIPVSWSFAIRELPPGADVPLPPQLSSLLDGESIEEARAAQIEQSFSALLEQQGPDAGLTR